MAKAPNGSSSDQSGSRKSRRKSVLSVGGMVESIVGCKWSLAVLDAIVAGVRRPGEMRRACDGISAKVLNERLRKLTRFGIVDRVVFPEVPPRVEYRLTRFGKQFVPLVQEVRNLQDQIDRAE